MRDGVRMMPILGDRYPAFRNGALAVAGESPLADFPSATHSTRDAPGGGLNKGSEQGQENVRRLGLWLGLWPGLCSPLKGELHTPGAGFWGMEFLL
jgi:hypothetical protein